MKARPEMHPSAETLKAFGVGKLDDLLAETVMEHLDTCADCREQVAAQSGDSFLDRLRRAHSQGSTPAPGKSLSELARSLRTTASLSESSSAVELPPELAENSQYEVLRELGRGGMGVVYLARHKLSGRHEVLKVMNKELLTRPGSKERFIREIQTAAQLDHPNVVKMHTALEFGPLMVLVIEYVPGTDLDSAVKKNGPVPVTNACYYIQQAALGLQHAWEKGMVHRDIKPQNLILSQDKKKQVVRILDFGLAKATSEKGMDPGLTGEGKMLGTPHYMAPEQIRDAAKADIRADIYSLGCTLHFLLTGETPFTGKSLYDILEAHQSADARPLNLMRPDVPEELAAVTRRMMAKDPARRYQAPLEVAQALAGFIKPGTKEAPPPAKLGRSLSLGAAAAPRQTKDAKPGRSVAPDVGKQTLGPRPASSAGDQKARLGTRTLAQGSQFSFEQAPPRRRTQAKASGNRKWFIGAGVVTIVLLMAFVGAWAAGVFKVKTRNGTIVIENLSSDAEVLVDGEKVTLTWGDGKTAEISVEPGTHKIVARSKDGLELVGEEVFLSEGEQRKLQAHVDSSTEASVKKTAPPFEPSATRPMPSSDSTVAVPPPVSPTQNWRPDPTTQTSEAPVVSLFGGTFHAHMIRSSFNGGTWSVDDGMLVGRGGPAPDNTAYLESKRRDYGDFHLHVEMINPDGETKLIRIRSSVSDGRFCAYGISTGGQAGTTFHAPGSIWRSIERVAEGAGDLPLLAAAKTTHVPNGQPYALDIFAESERIRVLVNNEQVAEYVDRQAPIREGGILLACRSPCQIKYRKLEIQDLLGRESVKMDGIAQGQNRRPAPSEGRPLSAVASSPGMVSPIAGTWEIRGDELVQTDSNARPAAIHFGSHEWKDYDFSFEAMREWGSADFGIRFRCTDQSNRYTVGAGGWDNAWAFFNVFKNGVYEELSGRKPFSLTNNVWYRALVKVRGRRLTAFIDGKTLLDVKDDRNPLGMVGLQTFASIYHFRNIRVASPDGTELWSGLPGQAGAMRTRSRPSSGALRHPERGFVVLFNGADLTGWKESRYNFGGNISIEQGGELLIAAEQNKIANFLIEKMYSDFQLRADVLYLSNRIGNIAVRYSENGDRGYMVMVGRAMTGCIGKRYADSQTVDWQRPANQVKPTSGTWLPIEIVCKGNTISVAIDDKRVLEYTDTLASYKSGIIRVGCSGPNEIHLRNLRIRELNNDETEP